jgi:hypothetical protein
VESKRNYGGEKEEWEGGEVEVENRRRGISGEKGKGEDWRERGGGGGERWRRGRSGDEKEGEESRR